MPDQTGDLGATVPLPPAGASASGGSGSATAHLSGLHGIESAGELAQELARFRSSALNPGRRSPRFSLGPRLGHGSQGVVYDVHDRDCRRSVAFKTLKWRDADRDEIARFVHEAQITAQLEHPGIVPVHDFGVLPDGTIFYTMKRIAGTPMHEWMRGRAGAPGYLDESLRVFLRMCEAIAFAHSRSVVHRDLKPRNVMIGSYGEVLVVDWGLAKVLGASSEAQPGTATASGPRLEPIDDLETGAGVAVGTPAYMSPEQALGRTDRVDRRSDIYALGVILYELLCGESPYERGEVRRTLAQVAEGAWTPLERRAAGALVPRRLAAVAHRAMALEPERRYQHVDELAEDLRSFLAGKAVAAYRESPWETLVRWTVRNRRAATSAAAVAGLALLVGLALWLRHERSQAVQAGAYRHAIAERELAGDPAAALAASERLLTLVPTDAAGIAARARLTETMRREEERRAAILAERGRATQARTLLDEAIVGRAAGDEAGLAAAVAALTKALALTPADPSLAAAYRETSLQLAERAASRRAAEERAARAADAAALRVQADDLAARGDLGGAIGKLEAALALAPDTGGAQRLRELAAQQADRERTLADQARQEATASTQRERLAAADTAVDEAMRAADSGDPGRAAAALERARALAPGHPRLTATQAAVDAAANRLRASVAARLVAEARNQLAEAARAAAMAATLRSEVQLHAARLAEGDAAARPALAAAERRLQTAAGERAKALGTALAHLYQAEAAASDDPAVRSAMAGFFIDRLLEAEDAGDADAAEAALVQARAYAGPEQAALIAGDGTLRNTGLTVIELRPLAADGDRVLRADGAPRTLPVQGELSLPQGRWLASAGGVAQALRLRRGGLAEIALPKAPADLPGGCVVVPAGDLVAPDGRPGARIATLVAMQREVTCGEWLRFLADPAVLRAHDEALARGELALAPREAFDAEQPAWARPGGAGFALAERTTGRPIAADAPVSGISWEDAMAYAAWRARRDGRPWRLPTADEWAFLVQGGDGRAYPWGDAADPGLCASAVSAGNDPGWRQRAGGTHPADRSVQGVEDLAGSRSEFATGQAAGGLRLLLGGNLLDREAGRFTAHARREVDRRLVSAAWGLRLVYTP